MLYKGQAAYGKTKVCPRVQTKQSKMGFCGRIINGRFTNDKENWIHVPVPAIINEDLFDAVQVQLAENKQRARARQRSETYLLQSLIVCQRCQYSYSGTRVQIVEKEKKILILILSL